MRNESSIDTSANLDQFATDAIRRKARRIVASRATPRSEQEDIEQELSYWLLKQRSAYDPSKGHWNAFVVTLIERRAANLARERNAKKRMPKNITSLQTRISNEDGRDIELSQLISTGEVYSRHGTSPRSEMELTELLRDTVDLLGTLPDELRDLATRLTKQNLSQVARELGVSRTTLSDSIRRLRRRFERAGLRDYL